MDNFFLPIESGNLRLRPLMKSDLHTTLNWRNQKHIRKWFIDSNIISWKKHKNWFEKYLKNKNDYTFIVEENNILNKAIGQISIYNIDWTKKRAELGRLIIGENSARRKGLAKKAVLLLLKIAFQHFLMKELYLSVFKNNYLALHIYEYCGFKKIKESSKLLQMSLAREDYIEIVED